MHDAAVVAMARDASVRRFRSGDPEHAERLLRGPARSPRVLCLDGVNSMTGNPSDLPVFAGLAREQNAVLSVDDAHGLGVLGERGGYDPSPYGRRGNGVVRWFGEEGRPRHRADRRPLQGVLIVAGFIACPTGLKRYLKAMVPSYVYSGPVPVASLATALLGLDVNRRRGDDLRAVPWERTRTLLEHLDKKLGVATSNTSGFPLVELALADAGDLGRREAPNSGSAALTPDGGLSSPRP